MRQILFGGFYLGKIWKKRLFSGWLLPDCGNTARAAMAGLGSIGLILHNFLFSCTNCTLHGPIITGFLALLSTIHVTLSAKLESSFMTWLDIKTNTTNERIHETLHALY